MTEVGGQNLEGAARILKEVMAGGGRSGRRGPGAGVTLSMGWYVFVC